MSDAVAVAEAPEIVEHAGLPVRDLNAALPHLRRPFTPQAIRFKVQNVFAGASGCIIVAYIDARLVVERLNAVAGAQWAADYRPAQNDKLMLCDLTVFGVRRTDVGGSPKGASKDLISDSLKRAAVQFGIGVSVYSLPEIKIFTRDASTEKHPPIETFEHKTKGKSIRLTEAGHTVLRGRYRFWLDNGGIRLFGKELDHGDVEANVANGEVEEQTAPEDDTPAAPVLVHDAEALALVETATMLKDEIATLKGGRARMPGGQFAVEMEQAKVSHEALQAFVERLRGIYGELSA